MIYKSFIVEQDIDCLQNNIALFYGENLGLIDEFKNKLKKKNKKILQFTQEDILKDENIIIQEIQNISLFEEKKVIFINNITDKILDTLKYIQTIKGDNSIYLFGGILEKKSKLRHHFESTNDLDTIPCYKDNVITIKKIIHDELKDYSGLSPHVINKLIENSNLDRAKINNEIVKIKSYFNNKIIKVELLNALLNLEVNDDFEKLKNKAINGDKKETNRLLSTTILEAEKNPLYLSIINQRLIKLKEVANLKLNKSLAEAVNSVKPPIFWKDKPNFLEQARLWDKTKLESALNKTYESEIKIKSDSNINKNIIIKKLLLDVCVLANSS